MLLDTLQCTGQPPPNHKEWPCPKCQQWQGSETWLELKVTAPPKVVVRNLAVDWGQCQAHRKMIEEYSLLILISAVWLRRWALGSALDPAPEVASCCPNGPGATRMKTEHEIWGNGSGDMQPLLDWGAESTLSPAFIPNCRLQDFLRSYLSRHMPYQLKVKESEVIQSCPILCDPMDCSLPGFSICPWDFLGKSTGVGCHFLLRYQLHAPKYHGLHWHSPDLLVFTLGHSFPSGLVLGTTSA